MIGVRRATVADAGPAETLLAEVAESADMPARVREVMAAAVRAAVESESEDERGCLLAFAADDPSRPCALLCYRSLTLSRAAADLEWIVVRRDGGEGARFARELIDALRVGRFGKPCFVRFSGNRWQRSGLDPHQLDAAGMRRAGGVTGFFGRGDDLVVFVAPPMRTTVPLFDPTNPAMLVDAAFSYRDFAFETEFLLACAAHYGRRKVRRAASWGCWAGRHVRALAEKNIDGVGVDETSEVLALAEAAFVEELDGPATATWVLARLDDPVSEPPVDLSFAMLSAVHRVGSNASMVRHLRSVADLLAPGGVHVIEATLPVDATTEGNTQTVWTERRGDFEITSKFNILVDRRARSGAVPTVLDVRCRRACSRELAGAFHQEELWLVPDAEGWRALAAEAGRFEVAALLGDFQLDIAWDKPGAWRMIVVLRRTEEPS